ncbi:alpha/beta fold hydrolase [Roseovarius sp. 2305UL8-3]|uniref:alpha/beta fold hydrolase n=1 Tax=Roseovarius conchicola TaxID=3121636 RepID=UPI003529A810
MKRKLFPNAIRALAVLLSLWCFWVLEADRASVAETKLETVAGPVALYGDTGGPLVVVTHGFAGSTQMMQAISRDLARGGFTVAAFDFLGHGRSSGVMSRDITRIEGTTAQLVTQTVAVAQAVRDETGLDGPMALLGHSMATDIIVRAAEVLPDVGALVAISMYSQAVGADRPKNLLILSGEWETRLRAVALEAVHLLDPGAVEGQTVRAGDVTRRAAMAPMTEHLGVLYSPVTLAETRNWLAEALDHDLRGDARVTGRAIPGLLISLVILGAWAAQAVPQQRMTIPYLSTGRFLVALIAPVVPAMGGAVGMGGALLGLAAFGHLMVFFLVWGVVGLVILARFGRAPDRIDPVGLLMVLGLCLVFSLAMDRYWAAFLPAGQRLQLMALLLLGTVPFLMADRLLVADATLWQRVLARVVPLAALTGLMIGWPEQFGLLFTVLPVLVLFYLVFGTMGRFVAKRAGSEAVGLGLGIVLAWSIAASTPLFSAVM